MLGTLQHVSDVLAPSDTSAPIAQVSPKGDLVLIATADAEEKTTGGVLLPTTAQRKPTSGARLGTSRFETNWASVHVLRLHNRDHDGYILNAKYALYSSRLTASATMRESGRLLVNARRFMPWSRCSVEASQA